jgi:uroporphyrinogen decarboxylase
MLRRQFLATTTASLALWGRPQYTPIERINRVLQGNEVDRSPFTFWHHFGLHTPEDHAKATLDFHRTYRTDLVKVMSDFPYPRPTGKWYELKPVANPFPQQIRALELIRFGLGGQKYFVETLFNPWNVAEKLSSKEEVLRLAKDNPTALMAALDAITTSEINHAKLALAKGAAGIFLSVANANTKSMSRADYLKFSAPFDRRILQAVSAAKLNVLHLHVENGYLDIFRDFPAAVVNYSVHVTGIPLAEARKQFSSVLMGGVDEVNYRKLTEAQIKAQWNAAQAAAGKKFLLAPGCSVPNESTPEELTRFTRVVGA